MNESEIKKIKEKTEEFLKKMTITDFNVELKEVSFGLEDQHVIDLKIELKEPQILIGSNGQGLFELQHILKIILNKEISRLKNSNDIKDSLESQHKMEINLKEKFFYVTLDINNYKKKKIEYLKNLAKDVADEVSLTREKKLLFPMPAYQRRIIHMELAQRQDITTESQGDGENRYVVVNPK